MPKLYSKIRVHPANAGPDKFTVLLAKLEAKQREKK